jgi:hypothetical protein
LAKDRSPARPIVPVLHGGDARGRRRIQAELVLLGHEVAELTIAKYKHRASPRPSPSWCVFLTGHLRELVAIDFFVIPTLAFRRLFVFVVLRHDRRELVHFNVTDHPTAGWTARQLVEAFSDDTAPTYLLRDRDGIDGEEFVWRGQGLGIRDILTAPRAPLAESVRGTGDRLDPPRVPRPPCATNAKPRREAMLRKR